MTTFWWLQAAADVVLCALVIQLFRLQNRDHHSEWEEKIAIYIERIEARARKVEEDLMQSKAKCDEQLQQLAKVTEQATKILNKTSLSIPQFPASQEEKEIQAALESPMVKEAIPTVAHIERTRERLDAGIALDLKTVLKDQLI